MRIDAQNPRKNRKKQGRKKNMEKIKSDYKNRAETKPFSARFQIRLPSGQGLSNTGYRTLIQS